MVAARRALVACAILFMAVHAHAQDVVDAGQEGSQTDDPDVESAGEEPTLSLPQPTPEPTKPQPRAPRLETTQPSRSASVQFMITNQMRQELGALGYSASEINSLVPERARVIVQHRIRRTSRGVPKQWQKSGGVGAKWPMEAVRWLGGIGAVIGALYAIDPALLDELLAPLRRAWTQSVLPHLRMRQRPQRRVVEKQRKRRPST